ncbi:MAG: hypothetical protein IGS39_26875, partial [Calothrix sp. C42_A2020_038]|nr:hypothetical protein [Calothrix sp. C42_A2020_038]
MTQSVTDKTPIPVTAWRRHIDPPGLWVFIVISSVILHLPLVWFLMSSGLNFVRRDYSSRPIPIDIVEVLPSQQNRRIKPTPVVPKPKLQPKPQSKPVDVKQNITNTQPKPIENKVKPPIAQAPQPDAIAFANPNSIKTSAPSPKVKKTPSLPPIKPKPTPKSTQATPQSPVINQEKRQQQFEEQLRQEELKFQKQIAQQRQQEQRRQQQIAQQRQQEQRRQQQIAQQRQQEQRR